MTDSIGLRVKSAGARRVLLKPLAALQPRLARPVLVHVLASRLMRQIQNSCFIYDL